MTYKVAGGQLLDSELCVGNTDKGASHVEWLRSAGVTSARLGNVALDIYGHKLSSNYSPVIIASRESYIYDRIMMAKYSAIMAGRA